MGELREGVEGYESPQHSNMLVDDINFVVTKKQDGDWIDLISVLGYFTHFYTDSHHIIDEGERGLREGLSPWDLYYIDVSRKRFPLCPQMKWRGYRKGEIKRIETLIKKIDGVLEDLK